MIQNIENGTLTDWKNVLVNTQEKLINESDVQIYNSSDVVDTDSIYHCTANGTSKSDYCVMDTFIKTPDEVARDKKYASFEWNFWVLDGSFDVLDDTQNERVRGYMTSTLSDSGCYLQEYMVFSNLTSDCKRQIHSVKFNPAYGFVPKQVYLYSNGINVAYDLETMADNNYIETAQYVYLNFPQYESMNDIIFLTIRDTNMPFRRGRITEWDLGFQFFVDKYDLQDFEHSRTCKLNMQEIPQNDVTFSFADKWGYLDPLKVNQPYKHTFSKNDDFRVYYGYKLDNGWSWALVENLKFNAIEVDRDSIKTTIKIESPINRWTNNYPSTTLANDSWSTLGTLLTKLYDLATGNSGGITGQTTLNFVNSFKGGWRLLLQAICRFGNNDFVQVPLSELIQQAVAFGNGFLLRTPTDWEIKKFVGSNGKISSSVVVLTPDDTVRAENCLSFPIVENLEKYAKGTFESNAYNGQDADEETQLDIPNVGTKTLLPYRKTENLISGGTIKEFTAHNDIMTVGYKGDNAYWNWDSGVHTPYLWYMASFDCGNKVSVEGILNPLIQLGDIIKVFTSEEYEDYQGLVEEITINYDGSFRGKLVLNQPYAE